MKKYITVAILVLLPAFIFAQLAHPRPEYYRPDTTKKVADNSSFDAKKLDYHLEIGTSVGGMLGGGSFMSSYIAPSVSYPITSRLNLTAGVVMEKNYFNNIPTFNGDGSITSTNSNSINNYFFAKADYLVSERLRVTGSILYGMNQMGITGTNNINTPNVSAYSFSADYKIMDGMHIGISVRKSQGFNPYNYNPYQSQPMIGTPFIGQ